MISSDDSLFSPKERELQQSTPTPVVETTPWVRENDPDEPPVPVFPKKVLDTVQKMDSSDSNDTVVSSVSKDEVVCSESKEEIVSSESKNVVVSNESMDLLLTNETTPGRKRRQASQVCQGYKAAKSPSLPHCLQSKALKRPLKGSSKSKALKQPPKGASKFPLKGSPKTKALKQPQKVTSKSPSKESPKTKALKQPLKGASKLPLKGSPKTKALKQPQKVTSKSPSKESPKSKALKQPLKGASKSPSKESPKSKALKQPQKVTSKSPSKESPKSKALKQPQKVTSKSPSKGSPKSKVLKQPLKGSSKSPKSKALKQPSKGTSKSALKGSPQSKVPNKLPKSPSKVSPKSKALKQPLKGTSKLLLPGKNSKLPKDSSGSQKVTKSLKRPAKGKCKRGLYMDANVLSTGTHIEPRSETTLNNTSIKTVKVIAKGMKRPTTDDPIAGTQRKSKRAIKKTAAENMDSEALSSPTTELSAALLSSNCPALSQSSAGPSSSTPNRVRGSPRKLRGPGQTSTPDRSSFTDNNLFSISVSPLRVKREEEEGDATHVNHSVFDETSVETSPCSKPKAGRRPGNPQAAAETRRSKRAPKGQSQGPNDGPPAKRCRGRKGPKTEEGNPGSDTTTQPPSRCRPRFEPLEVDSPEQDRLHLDDTSLSSDLSIEFSQLEDLTSLPTQEEDDEEDEEELPSFLIQMDKQPPSITEGICVWCKFRNYPFWPAMVKSVNRKQRKASIVFIDNRLFDKKLKGLTVALKTLKPFDCEDADQLVCKAKEKYNAAINWCLELIADYRIRIGCGSFTGSFIEYFADDISCPVRRKYLQGASEEHVFPSKLMMEEQFDLHERESFTEQQEKFSTKKLLPDRTQAARNRANEKLVQYIVKQRMVERRLLAVISGQQQSRWLRSFLRASRKMVDVYLEDEGQLDQVYHYLKQLYDTAPNTAPCLANVDPIRFVLDVLLPEAIIYAIAGVDEVSVKKAEEKYLKGPCMSNREREEFDWMIEQQLWIKSHQNNVQSTSST